MSDSMLKSSRTETLVSGMPSDVSFVCIIPPYPRTRCARGIYWARDDGVRYLTPLSGGPGLSGRQRPGSGELGRFQKFVGLDDLPKAILQRPVAAIGVRMKLFDPVLVTRLDGFRICRFIETERIQGLHGRQPIAGPSRLVAAGPARTVAEDA